jgi:hypothetical protein
MNQIPVTCGAEETSVKQAQIIAEEAFLTTAAVLLMPRH